MKVIIAGGRKFNNYHLLKTKVNNILKDKTNIEIVSGTAYGADKLGEEYSKQYNLKLKQFPADWNQYGKSAGYIRNEEMAKYAGAAIIFWDGVSKGTKHMISLAEKYKLKLRIIRYE